MGAVVIVGMAFSAAKLLMALQERMGGFGLGLLGQVLGALVGLAVVFPIQVGYATLGPNLVGYAGLIEVGLDAAKLLLARPIEVGNFGLGVQGPTFGVAVGLAVVAVNVRCLPRMFPNHVGYATWSPILVGYATER